MTALATRDLKVHFGGVKAVDGLSLSIREGGVHAIIGPNGAGKTSFINAMTGVYRPTAGRVLFDGIDVTGKPAHALARLGMTRTFQNLQVFWTMSVLENVVCGFYLHSSNGFWPGLFRTPSLVRRSRDIESKAFSLLEKVGLAARASDAAKALSYGELKRLEIARAIACEPKVLLLDEPVAGCTSLEKRSVGQLIRSIAETSQTTIILVEHDMKLVMSISDRVSVLVEGKLFADGTPEFVRNDHAVIEAYLGKPAERRERERAATG
ncbi:MAG: ABC transporter ATP-binding protein [Pseudomonadota bacterium]